LLPFHTVPITFNVYVVENFKFDLLLGNDFNQRFNVEIDYKNDQLTVLYTTSPMLKLVTRPLPSTHQLNSNPVLDNKQSLPPNTEPILKTPISNISTTPVNTINYSVVKSTIIPARTLIRIPVKSSHDLENINIIQSSIELIEQQLQLPDIILLKTFSDNLTLPILNATSNAITLPINFLIATSNISNYQLSEYPENIPSIPSTNKTFPSISNEDHIKALLSRISPDTTDFEKSKFEPFLAEYADVFAKPNEIGNINCYKHSIRLIPGAQPVKKAPYRKPAHLEAFERQKIQELLEARVIRPSHSAWGMGIVIVEEGHQSGSLKTPRFCIDYRPLNAQVHKDAFPIPNIQTIFDWIGRRSKYISLMDCAKGFWGLPLDETSIPLTAFISQSGLYEWVRMPFGVCNGSSAYQRAMSIILCGLLWESVLAFIDDIISADNSIETHIENLKLVFERFRKYGVKLSIPKSTFLSKNIKILGHIISPTGIIADPEKIKAILNIPIPQNKKQVLSFLGCVGYFRKFIKSYSDISKPLTLLTHKDIDFKWTDMENNAFEKLKTILTSPPLLVYFNPNLPIHIYTDASGYGISACLLQPQLDNSKKPVSFCSRTLTKSQQKFSTIEREFFAIIFALKIFHAYIYGKPFKIFTDHKPLIGLKFATSTNISSRLTNWALLLQEYDYQLFYTKRSQNRVADELSRKPLPIEDHTISTVEPIGISELQMLDEDCQNLKKNLQSNTKLSFCNNILYHKSKQGFQRIVLPLVLRSEILHDIHDIPISAHFGFTRCFKKLSRIYYWPSMKKDLYSYIQSCSSCIAQKRHYGKIHGLLKPIPVPSEPFEMVSTDILGPFPISDSGNKYIINAICLFSKWAEIRAIPDQTSETIAKFLEEQVFCRHAAPKILLSDNGPSYISKILSAYTKLYRVSHRFITPYNSRSNGLSERLNQTVSKMISHYVNSSHTNWDTHIYQLNFAYNTTVQESTTKTPFEIIYGRHPSFPYEFTKNDSFYDNSK